MLYLGAIAVCVLSQGVADLSSKTTDFRVQPLITAISPAPVVGSNDRQWLTIDGSGFADDFTAHLQSGSIAAHIKNRGRLLGASDKQVQVQATFGTEAATWCVQIINPDEATSPCFAFEVVAPEPVIESIEPIRKTEDEPGFTLTVYGAFAAYSSIHWKGHALPTRPLKSSEESNAITLGLEAFIGPEEIAEPGAAEVQVYTPSPGGGLSPPVYLFTTKRLFYQTTWFNTLCLLGLVLVGSGLYHYRIRRVKRQLREKKLVRLVEERTLKLDEEKQKTEAQAAQLKEQAERLLEMDRMKSRFFANISHEFRTPLTLIQGPIISLLDRSGDELGAETRRQLNVAIENTRRLEWLTDQMLDLSRLEAGQFRLRLRPVDLVLFLEQMVDAFMPLAERNELVLEYQTQSQPLYVHIDPGAFEKVIGNLLSNALKFTPSPGRVLVSVAKEEDDEAAILRVRDTGVGIEAEALPHIFDRFYQVVHAVHRASEGVGIGLSLVKELVELHGGQVGVASEPGFGTEFRVTLPLHTGSVPTEPCPERALIQPGCVLGLEEDLARGHMTETAPEPESTSMLQPPPVILIVEDNAEVGRLLRNHLQVEYTIEEARNGREALEVVHRHRPHLIISDVMMPEMDGVALCHALKSDAGFDDIPIILLTAKAGEQDRLDGLGAGADDYVRKPFSFDELQARIRNLLESRQALRRRYSREVVVQPTGVTITSEEEAFYEQVRQAVEHHLGDPHFTVEMLADAVCLTKSTLSRKLRAATGMSPAEMVRYLRLQHASHLLAGHAGRVAEVATAVGYRDVDHFTRLFRERFGAPPSEYGKGEALVPGKRRTQQFSGKNATHVS
ncbi:MAG: ATP-binding protein [Rhodothermales bacterium]